MKQQFDITGMSCAACSAKVEKAVSKLDGITECSVNLLTNTLITEGTVEDDVIIDAVRKAGYGATIHSDEIKRVDDKENKKTEKTILIRLISSIVLLLILMYISMGYTMWHFPLPSYLVESPVAIAFLQMLLALAIMVINNRFFVNGVKGVIHLSPNMDTLVSLGSFSAFAYSFAILIIMISKNDIEVAKTYLNTLYFDSAGMVLTLITIGKLLEAKAKGKTTSAIKDLMKLRPNTVTIIKDGKKVTIDAKDANVGDIFVVYPGETVALDGEVINGSTSIDESILTGESLPVDKVVGDEVSTGTINSSGYIECRALRVGEETTISKIIKLVNDATATKAPIAKIADKVAGVFVPVVLGIALITLIVWLCIGKTFGYSLARAISVLVISCPCALGLATPVAIMVGSGVGAKNGILFKTAVSLEVTGKANIVAFDKTGTITKGKPEVTDVISLNGSSTEDILKIIGTLECNSEHPIAKAIMEYVNSNNIKYSNPDEFINNIGSGIKVKLNNDILEIGNLKLISKDKDIDKSILDKMDELANLGKTPLFVLKNSQIIGIVAIADMVKEDSIEAISNLKAMGYKVVMITGDNDKTAKAISNKVGIDKVYSEVLPMDKEKIIASLKEEGKVIMVGDGINDAPALTRADIGIAIGNGTDIAIDSADVVVMNNSINDVVKAIRLSKGVIRNIHENLGWAFGYNIIGIPLAAGVFVPLFHWSMNPMFGSLAMSISSFLVVTNALRLNFIKLDKHKIVDIVKTININGMMCEHCENNVKSTLLKMDGVSEAKVSHKKGTAVVSMNKNIDDEVLKEAVEKIGYEVTNISIQKVKKHNKGKDKTMTKLIHIKGMMCEHCEARVKGLLEGLDGVTEAKVSHKTNDAKITLSKEVDNDIITKVIEDNGYKVTGIE